MMKIRIIGGGWYGCHLAVALSRHAEVELWESQDGLFLGASGANPARLHQGFHYPRSRLTRAACADHAEAFMTVYGHLTAHVPVNIYAVAAHDSWLDFGTYKQVLQGVPFIPIPDPERWGLANVEGAVLTGERHIVIRKAREHFTAALKGLLRLGREPKSLHDPKFDWTIDCTFCAFDAEAIDRFEPCVTGLVAGPTATAVTIMDGPFPSLYPWDDGLSSLTSASLTPLSKTCRSYEEAREQLDAQPPALLIERCDAMLEQLAIFWPAAAHTYHLAGYRTAIRAMPRSGADARLVDVIETQPGVLRVRAGKIDAIFRAEALIRERLGL